MTVAFIQSASMAPVNSTWPCQKPSLRSTVFGHQTFARVPLCFPRNPDSKWLGRLGRTLQCQVPRSETLQGALMRHLPWKKLGYAALFLLVLGIYPATYYVLVAVPFTRYADS